MGRGQHAWLLDDHGTAGDRRELLRLGRQLEAGGDQRLAATAYDRAYGLDPGDAEVADARRALLDAMAVEEHGIRFRYIPAGTFLMGSGNGDPDERPVHPVRLDDYWMAETTISWAAYCDLMGWHSPPDGSPPKRALKSAERTRFALAQEDKIRLQYCEDATTQAGDWHAHVPVDKADGDGDGDGDGGWRKLFGTPPRENPDRPWMYDVKPMVSVSWQEAEALCERLSSRAVRYRLPTEAEWERAARGGLIACRYPWGDEPPTPERCDFDRLDQFSILPPRRLPPNGYGLYGMSGSVWEWTGDWYDRDYYQDCEDQRNRQEHPAIPVRNPAGPPSGQEHVLRGGSWADCAETVTVSFRMSHGSSDWRVGPWGDHMTPNFGFRLCRTARNISTKRAYRT